MDFSSIPEDVLEKARACKTAEERSPSSRRRASSSRMMTSQALRAEMTGVGLGAARR